jgi:hypothetical protein
MEVAGTAVGAISLGIQVIQSLVDYYTAYKHRESDVQYTFKKLTHILNVLEILRKQLGSRKFRSDERSVLDTVERCIGNCEDVVNELNEETEKIHKASSSGIVAAAREAGRRLAYPFRKSTLQKLDEDVDDMCANLTLALQVLQQHDMGSVQDEIQDTKALLELIQASQLSADIRAWLKPPDASINYNEACKKKHPGTGLWFVKSAAFSSWLSTRHSFLLLRGFAGCGKSVLSSTIIQYTFRHRRSNPLIGIAFFYFTFNDESKQDTSAMLRALVLQLAGQLKDQDAPVAPLYQSYRGSTPPDQALLDCLHQLVRKFDDVYLVVDALDESPRHTHREDLLQALEDIRHWSESGLHLLVTSRDEQDIREHLDPPAGQVVLMKNDSIDSDITSFISGHLDTKRFQKWEKHRDQIERALTQDAKGV